MIAGIRRIGRLHLPKAAYRDRDMGVSRGPKLIVEVDIRNFAIEFVLSANRVAAAARRNLKVEPAEQIAILPRRTTFYEQRRGLQFIYGGRQARDR